MANKVKIYSEKIKALRDNKTNLESKIHSHISDYDKKPTINISDGVLKFGKVNVQQPLSYKLIESSLTNIITDKNQIEAIINTIKSHRVSREQDVIKRFYR